MDVNEVSKKVMEWYPKKAIDIAECLGLLLDTLDSTASEINHSITQLLKRVKRETFQCWIIIPHS